MMELLDVAGKEEWLPSEKMVSVSLGRCGRPCSLRTGIREGEALGEVA